MSEQRSANSDPQTAISEQQAADSDQQTAIGDPQTAPAVFAPNLTPSGLTMVYEQSDGSGVYIATRAALADRFGDATLILPGDHRAPQLLGACTALYTVDPPSDLVRYDRP